MPACKSNLEVERTPGGSVETAGGTAPSGVACSAGRRRRRQTQRNAPPRCIARQSAKFADSQAFRIDIAAMAGICQIMPIHYPEVILG
ncbi:hypothetical protein [Methylobacterium sp. 174MFSha1.1]|uniref:hypothetical protein n=1 Tax=Methylobacterium sp. 174MFSha1.1 TaxID=1502749 RepID=UPI001160C463|nr:hypothetical protein [Methylobacterium sp. 174MFSha1.1]